jgi:hypothetical protein
MNTLSPSVAPKKRNFAISYIKGIAIIFIILIHLIDWGDIQLSATGRLWKQVLFTGVVFFMATAGSVIWIAYGKSDDLLRPTKRLMWRGLQLIGVYYIYNIIKFAIFDYSKENFYYGYASQGIFNWNGILTMKAFAVPIPILVTIGYFVILSPLFLLILKKVKGGVYYLLGLLAFVIMVNYFVELPHTVVTNFLYGRGYIFFSPLPWFTAFLLGLLVAYAGFDQKKKLFLALFTLLIPLSVWYATSHAQSLFIDESLHPLKPLAISVSFAFMFVLMFVFGSIEKFSKNQAVRMSLSVLRVLGDCTLWLYVAHWIAIDVTLWVFAPRSYFVWISMIPLFLGFFVWKRGMIKKYFDEYENN